MEIKRPIDRPVRYNEKGKQRYKQIVKAFELSGFELGDARALARLYIECLADKTYRDKTKASNE